MQVAALETVAPTWPNVTPLVLSDRLISLAEQADKAGLRQVARHLLRLACAVLEETPGVAE